MAGVKRRKVRGCAEYSDRGHSASSAARLLAKDGGSTGEIAAESANDFRSSTLPRGLKPSHSGRLRVPSRNRSGQLVTKIFGGI